MYGSFAHGEGDRHSDLEFWLFFVPEQREADPRGWCAQVGPLTYIAVNEFGAYVAFFTGLVRGEFHFATSEEIDGVRLWPAQEIATDRMIVLDRRGALREALEALRQRGIVPPLGDDEVAALCGRFANWLVLAHHVAERGEIFRAVDALAHMQRHLLWMARLAEGRTHHWLTPSRCAEAELSRDAIELLRGAVPRGATGADVRKAIHAAWQYGKRLWEELAARHKLELPDGLFMQIDQAVAAPNPVL
jgi:lincosamide nucleotidyltransferase